MDRLYKFDNIKVWLMMLVIIAHTLINSYGDSGQEYIRFFCLCYTMPLFTVISGYLSKPESQWSKNIKYLLIPCILFTLINDGVQWLVNPIYHFTWKQSGFSMWYLWALFVFRVSLPYLLKVPYVLPLSFVASWIVGFIPFVGGDYSLSRIICFLPYFLLGYYIKGVYKANSLINSGIEWRGVRNAYYLVCDMVYNNNYSSRANICDRF